MYYYFELNMKYFNNILLVLLLSVILFNGQSFNRTDSSPSMFHVFVVLIM